MPRIARAAESPRAPDGPIDWLMHDLHQDERMRGFRHWCMRRTHRWLPEGLHRRYLMHPVHEAFIRVAEVFSALRFARV